MHLVLSKSCLCTPEQPEALMHALSQRNDPDHFQGCNVYPTMTLFMHHAEAAKLSLYTAYIVWLHSHGHVMLMHDRQHH